MKLIGIKKFILKIGKEVIKMFCGRCGADDEKTFVKNGFVVTVDEVYYYKVGKCTQCGELLGTKEVYTLDHCEEMSREEAKKLLINAGINVYV